MSELESESQESTECPACGRSDFATVQGMKTHHKRIHGESIAGINRVCEHCGDGFAARRARVDRGEAKFCSYKCRHGSRESQGMVTRICEQCGEEFTIPKTQLNHRPVRFCSLGCTGKWASETRVGTDHHRWKGGQFPYGEGWTDKKKEAVRDRDSRQCQRCGMNRSEHVETYGKALEVHHIVPARQFDDAEARNAMDNLLTLCIPCHRKWEGIPLRPEVV